MLATLHVLSFFLAVQIVHTMMAKLTPNPNVRITLMITLKTIVPTSLADPETMLRRPYAAMRPKKTAAMTHVAISSYSRVTRDLLNIASPVFIHLRRLVNMVSLHHRYSVMSSSEDYK